MLTLNGIHAGYGRVEVLRGVDLTVPAGSVVALLGANGAGKTTRLRVAAGLLAPCMTYRSAVSVRSQKISATSSME